MPFVLFFLEKKKCSILFMISFDPEVKRPQKPATKLTINLLREMYGGDIDPLLLTKATPGDLPTKVLDVRDTMRGTRI